MTQFFQQLSNGLALGSLYALVAIGYTIVYGIIQLINFAHGEIFMIGSFGALATWTWGLGESTALWTLPVLLVAAVATSVVVSLIVERIAYRPLRNAPRLAPLITAIGVSIVLQELIRTRYPGATSRLPFPSIDVVSGAPLSFGPVLIQRSTLLIIALMIACGLFVNYFVQRTRSGRAMQATAQDPDTARLMGIDVDRIIVIAFVLGASLAGIAGLAQGIRYGTINYFDGFTAGLKAFTAAVLGGIGNINGAILGGLLVGLIETMATEYIPGQFGGNAWKDVWAFVVLIIVLVLRPQGLLGARVTDRA